MLLFGIDKNKINAFVKQMDKASEDRQKAKEVFYNFDFETSTPTNHNTSMTSEEPVTFTSHIKN